MDLYNIAKRNKDVPIAHDSFSHSLMILTKFLVCFDDEGLANLHSDL